MEKIGMMKALRNYFGMKPGQTLQDFAAEIKQLSDAEKLELAQGAARELGAELDIPATSAAA